jgi:hypothetical protein
MTQEYHVLNLGAGVQSTTLYLMSVRRDEPEHVPPFDCAIFADTQDEPAAVYEHLDWLRSLGGPPILADTAGHLGDDLARGVNSTGQRFASIPAYTMGEGADREGRTRRQCTREYKTDVVERAIRRRVLGLPPGGRVPADVRVIQYLGLSFDEPGRVAKVKARFGRLAWSEPRFPLFDLFTTRAGCRLYLETAAPGRAVPRSACVFCPFHSNAEWRHLRDKAPGDWERACSVDDALRAPGSVVNRGLDAKLYVHRSCKPLREAPIDTPESRGEQYQFGFAQECEGMCGL